MKNKFYIILFLILLSGLSCTNNKKTYFPNGNLLKEYEVNSFGEKNGSYKEYYPSGKVRLIAKFKKNKLDGSRKWFYEDGKLYIENFNKKGIDSCYIYYENGFLGKGIIKDNKMSGWWKIYSSKTNELYSLREFISVPENKVYLNQNIVYLNGKLIDSLSYYYKIKIKDPVSVNEKIDVDIYFFTPKNKRAKLKLTEFYSSQNFDLTFKNQGIVTKKKLKLLNNLLLTSTKFNNKGTNYIRGFYIEKNLIANPNMEDSSLVNVEQSTLKMYISKKVVVN